MTQQWVPWTLKEIAEWERKALAGTLFEDAPPKPARAPKPRLELPIAGVEHGTVRGYVDGCKCAPCSKAAAPYLSALGLSK